MKFSKATVRLEHDDVKEAIRQYVAAQGWHVGAVIIAVDPHQYNGPDTFSATVEVEPRAAVEPKPFRPAIGQRAKCKDCGRGIIFDGKCWGHEGEPKPRHPAVPALDKMWSD